MKPTQGGKIDKTVYFQLLNEVIDLIWRLHDDKSLDGVVDVKQ